MLEEERHKCDCQVLKQLKKQLRTTHQHPKTKLITPPLAIVPGTVYIPQGTRLPNEAQLSERVET